MAVLAASDGRLPMANFFVRNGRIAILVLFYLSVNDGGIVVMCVHVVGRLDCGS